MRPVSTPVNPKGICLPETADPVDSLSQFCVFAMMLSFLLGYFFYIWSDSDFCSQTAFGLFESTGQPTSRASLSQSSQINSRNALRIYTLSSFDNGNKMLSSCDRLHFCRVCLWGERQTTVFGADSISYRGSFLPCIPMEDQYLEGLHILDGEMPTPYVAVLSISLTRVFDNLFQCLLPKTTVLIV